MRGIVGLYLGIGIVLLAIGFLLPGPCLDPDTDAVSNIVFVLTWPVGLYDQVYHGHLSARDWLRNQACQAGGPLGPKKTAPSASAPSAPAASAPDGSHPVPIPPPAGAGR
jgi:hypothetical protein